MSRVEVVAIVNRTPDSFHDRGATWDLMAAVNAACAAARAGADWVDVGGCPIGRADQVDEAEERRRVLPLVAQLAAGFDGFRLPIMVDTFRAAVARAAMARGAAGINDSSGLYDPQMARVAAETGAWLVLTHSLHWPDPARQRDPYGDVVLEVRAELHRLVEVALDAGVRPDRIVIDPGHDLWKSPAESLELTRRLRELGPYPIMAALSNKAFVADIVTAELLPAGTVAANTAAILRGASWIRVHDVPAGVAAARMGEAVLGDPPEANRSNPPPPAQPAA